MSSCYWLTAHGGPINWEAPHDDVQYKQTNILMYISFSSNTSDCCWSKYLWSNQ